MASYDHDTRTATDTGIQIQPGVPLVDKDGNYVGKVKEVLREKIVVERSAQHCADIQVPFEAILKTGAGQIRLDIAESEIDRQDW